MYRLAGDGVGRRDAASDRDRHVRSQSALRGRRPEPVRHPQGGAGARAHGQPPRTARRLGQAVLHQEPAPSPVPAHRQQTRHETIRQQKGSDEGENPTEGGRPLGHPSLLQLQVCP